MSRCLAIAVGVTAALFLGAVRAPTASAGTQCLVVSEVYTGGGDSGAVYNEDFIELHNRCSTPEPLGQVIYREPRGQVANTFRFSGSALQPGAFFLIAVATDGTVGANLPTPDETVAVLLASDGLAPSGGSVTVEPIRFSFSCPSDAIDLVGYGTQTPPCFEGAAAPVPAATTSLQRRAAGCLDSDNNAADFELNPPSPMNRASSPFVCPGGEASPPPPPPPPPASASADLAASASVSPASVVIGQQFTWTFAVTNKGPDAATAVHLTGSISSAGAINWIPGTPCSGPAASFSCTLPSLAADVSQPLTVTFTAVSLGTSVANFSVSSATADPNTSNNTATATLTVRDTQPPTVRARAATVPRHKLIKLLFDVFDDSDAVTVQAALFDGRGRTKHRWTQRISPLTNGPFSEQWRFGVAGRYRFCVSGSDAAGNRSPRSCAGITVKR